MLRLLLVLCVGVPPGGSWGTIHGAGIKTWVDYMQGSKALTLYYLSGSSSQILRWMAPAVLAKQAGSSLKGLKMWCWLGPVVLWIIEATPMGWGWLLGPPQVVLKVLQDCTWQCSEDPVVLGFKCP